MYVRENKTNLKKITIKIQGHKVKKIKNNKIKNG